MTVDEMIRFYDGDKIREHLLDRHGLGRPDKSKVLLLSTLHLNRDHGDVTIEDLGMEHFGWMASHLDHAEVVIFFDRKLGVTKLLKNRRGNAGQIVRDIDGIAGRIHRIRTEVNALVGTTADRMLGGCPICGYSGYIDGMSVTAAIHELLDKIGQ